MHEVRTSLPPERLAHVDSLRLVAAGFVVVQHLAERMHGPLAGALTALGPGVAGVVLFFLISGYVIPFSVRGGLDWRRFAVRRILRIYPLLLAALALVALAGWCGWLAQWQDLPQAGAGRWVANVLLVQDFVSARPILGVSWTLVFELLWYALFAAALLAFGRRAGTVLALAVPIGMLALAALSLASGLRVPLGRPGLIHAAVLGYQAFRFRTGALSAGAFGWNVAAFIGVTWLASAVSFGVFAHAHVTLAQVLGPWTVATALFLVVLLLPGLRGSALLDRGLAPRLGAASYSVYLLHPVALAAAWQYAPAAFLPVAAGLTALLAWGGYRLVELPGIALARRLTAPRGAPGERPSASGSGMNAPALSIPSARSLPARSPSGPAQPAALPAGRIGWLDAARGAGIVLVVVGHSLGGVIDSPLGAGQMAMRAAFFAIYTFHMPLFLLLSGLLVAGRIGRGAGAFVRGLLPTVVWPYFLWSALQFSLIYAAGSLVNRPADAWWPTLLALPWRTVSQFWFLYALFWMHLLAAAVLPRGGTRALLALGLALKLAAALLPLDVTVRLVAGNLVWYALGAWLGPEGAGRIVRALPALWRRFILPVFALEMVVAALAALGPGFGLARLASASSPEIANLAWRLPAIPAALAGCVATVALLARVQGPAADMLHYLGQRTMAIFVLHVIFVAGTRIVLTRLHLVADPVLLLPLLVAAGLAGPLLAERALRPLRLQRLLGF